MPVRVHTGDVRIPLKWGTDSGEVGQRRSEATLVTAMISEVPHLWPGTCTRSLTRWPGAPAPIPLRGGRGLEFYKMRLYSARSKRRRRKKCLPVAVPMLALTLMMPMRLTSYRLMCRLRGQSIHVDASVVVGDVDLAAINDGRVEFIASSGEFVGDWRVQRGG
jgi:hypothetical protein